MFRSAALLFLGATLVAGGGQTAISTDTALLRRLWGLMTM